VCASVATDNVLQIWSMAENIYNDDEFVDEGSSQAEEVQNTS